MRRLLLALLIALLPLRGWVADAMALPAPTASALVSIAEDHHLTLGKGHFEPETAAVAVFHAGCHDQTLAAAADDADAGTAAGCSTCTLCHSAVIAPLLAPRLPIGQLPAARPAPAARFASAAPAPGFKPPIS